MPLSPTTYLLLVRPTPGSDTDVWDDYLNTAFGLIDTHRHITGEGRPIPSAGIGIDADLSMAAKRLTSINGLAFNSIGLLAAGSLELFVSSNNLYYRNGAGTNVRLTSGNTLDMTTVGGIAGDYTSVGAEVAFTDGTDTYTFKQQVGAAVRQFAKMGSADLALYEYKAQPAAGVPTSAVTLKSPAALAAPYTITMPAALPGGTSLVTITSAGVLAAATSVPIDITLAANQSVIVSGTGDYKHGDRVLVVSAWLAMLLAPASWTAPIGAITSSVAADARLSLPLKSGDRAKSITFSLSGDGISDVTVTVYSVASSGTVGVSVTNLGTAVVSNPTAPWADTTINIADTTVSDALSIVCIFLANGANISVGNTRVTYDRP